MDKRWFVFFENWNAGMLFVITHKAARIWRKIYSCEIETASSLITNLKKQAIFHQTQTIQWEKSKKLLEWMFIENSFVRQDVCVSH